MKDYYYSEQRRTAIATLLTFGTAQGGDQSGFEWSMKKKHHWASETVFGIINWLGSAGASPFSRSPAPMIWLLRSVAWQRTLLVTSLNPAHSSVNFTDSSWTLVGMATNQASLRTARATWRSVAAGDRISRASARRQCRERRCRGEAGQWWVCGTSCRSPEGGAPRWCLADHFLRAGRKQRARWRRG